MVSSPLIPSRVVLLSAAADSININHITATPFVSIAPFGAALTSNDVTQFLHIVFFIILSLPFPTFPFLSAAFPFIDNTPKPPYNKGSPLILGGFFIRTLTEGLI